MSAVTLGTDAQGYAAAVRSHLDDLSAEEVEELAGGLDADLAELAAESPEPLAVRLGNPAGYAEELRSAAGLPPRRVTNRSRSALAAEWQRDLERLTSAVRSQSWWPAVRDFAAVVRPVWWVARAWVAFTVLVAIFAGVRQPSVPHGLSGWLLLAVSAVVSVQLGRGLWSRFGATRPLLTAGNVVAVLLLPLALTTLSVPEYVEFGSPAMPVEETPVTGLVVDGVPVANIYPYDAQGRPLQGVRLLDDRGRPLLTGQDTRDNWEDDGPHPFSAAVDADGTPVWNAYPLRASTDLEPGGRATVPALPERTLPPLLGSTPSASGRAPSAAPSSPTGADPTSEPASPSPSVEPPSPPGS